MKKDEVFHTECEGYDFNAPGCRNLLIVVVIVICMVILSVIAELWV